MTIQFRDLFEDEVSGTAGYLKFLRYAEADTWLAALFVIDARGEPAEFTYASIRAPSSFLWRPDDLRLHCLRSLCCAVFDACPAEPLLLLCLAEEVGPFLFSEHIQVQLPVARLSAADSVVSVSPAETVEDLSQTDSQSGVSLYWTSMPKEESPARQLVNSLSTRGLLLEPFQRAELGLHEVYAELLKQ